MHNIGNKNMGSGATKCGGGKCWWTSHHLEWLSQITQQPSMPLMVQHNHLWHKRMQGGPKNWLVNIYAN